MYKHILVAVDGSDISIQALHEAIKLAKEQQANLRLLYVADEDYVDYAGIGFDYDKYEAAMRKYGEKILKKAEDVVGQSNIEFDSRLIELKPFQGRVEEKIIQEAKTWPADLIVIGTHGRRGFSHFLLGSVAEGVVRIAPIPVLLIRGKQAAKS